MLDQDTLNKNEVVIVGGGIVGMLLALSLDRLNIKTLAIEQKPFEMLLNDNRSIALAYSSICVLHSLGLWEDIKDTSAKIKQIHVSDKKALSHVKLYAEEESLPFLGAVVKISVLLTVLLERLKSCESVTLLSGYTCCSLSLDDQASSQHYTLGIKSLNTEAKVMYLMPKLIVAADGANSELRKMADIAEKRHDYCQKAVVCDVSLKRDHGNWAYERFMTDGVLAMLPMAKNLVSSVWATTNDNADQLCELSDEEFVKTLQTEFGYRLGKIEKVSLRKSFPLSLVKADKLYQHNLLLFGNAAHFLHPVSAQGLNLSIRDVAVLFDLIQEDNHLTSIPSLLDAYRLKRQKDHKRTAIITHELMDLFTEDKLYSQKLRRLGMYFLERDRYLKRIFSQLMMGKMNYGASLMQKRLHK